jgi:hypothetical protein
MCCTANHIPTEHDNRHTGAILAVHIRPNSSLPHSLQRLVGTRHNCFTKQVQPGSLPAILVSIVHTLQNWQHRGGSTTHISLRKTESRQPTHTRHVKDNSNAVHRARVTGPHICCKRRACTP